MIVIKARGAHDVRALKKLARSLDAEDMPELPPQSHTPNVSNLPSARVSVQTRAALMKLERQAFGLSGDYEIA